MSTIHNAVASVGKLDEQQVEYLQEQGYSIPKIVHVDKDSGLSIAQIASVLRHVHRVRSRIMEVFIQDEAGGRPFHAAERAFMDPESMFFWEHFQPDDVSWHEDRRLQRFMERTVSALRQGADVDAEFSEVFHALWSKSAHSSLIEQLIVSMRLNKAAPGTGEVYWSRALQDPRLTALCAAEEEKWEKLRLAALPAWRAEQEGRGSDCDDG